MIEILQIIGGGIAWRIRGGLGNEAVRNFLKKPPAWEISNTYIRLICAVYFALLLPITWATPALIGLIFLGLTMGYFGQFDLSKKENKSWRNLSLLSIDGAKRLAPALCLFPLYPSLFGGVLAGGLMPLCSVVGFKIPEIKGVISHSQYAEFLLGATIAAGLLC